MNTFFLLLLGFEIQQSLSYLIEYICLFYYINHVRGANRSQITSVITVTGIKAVGYHARKRVFPLVLSLKIGIEAHIEFF